MCSVCRHALHTLTGYFGDSVAAVVIHISQSVHNGSRHRVSGGRRHGGGRRHKLSLLYALYGGLMAGLFEETGRFLAFKTVLTSRLWDKPYAEKTTFYAESGSKGPGAEGERVRWSHTLKPKDLKAYTPANVLRCGTEQDKHGNNVRTEWFFKVF